MMSILVTYTFSHFFAQFPAAPKIDDDGITQVAAILKFFSCHLFYDIIRYNCTNFKSFAQSNQELEVLAA